ncbi:DUF3540 domain-containing protein [Shewanella surugensis]|uniref:DUF3540 domain-containing protein n=1 Tax=Shewanella surugensis TaxID=212020 RepID=A0ABT0L7X6_9GAMM|nr:DUF3540 domain-containing protein [Shewanella surugensis]MCL1123477.1 DUF3540 domain-containing protein [Shewanella surugensis]
MNSILLSSDMTFNELYTTTGSVVACESKGAYCVDTAQGEVAVSLAASCLLMPAVGDVCTVAIDEDGEGWLLAILVQADPSQGILAHSGALHIAAQGALHFKGQRIMSEAEEQMHFSAGEVSVHSQRMAMHTEEASLSANKTQVVTKVLSMVADKVEHVVELWMQRLGESFRIIKGHDEKQSGSSRQLVEKDAVTHAKNVISSAEKQMIMEAEKIHLG